MRGANSRFNGWMTIPEQPATPQPDQPTPPAYAAPQYAVPVPPMNPSDERMWSTLIHLSGFILGFIGPLIGFLVAGQRGPFIRAHTATALNFQISIIIYTVALSIITVVTFGFGGLLYIPLGIAFVVFMILAAVAANQGRFYKYPLTIEFVK